MSMQNAGQPHKQHVLMQHHLTCIEHDMYTLFIRTMQINPNAVNEHSLNIHEPSQSSTPAARTHVDAIVSTS